MKIKKKLITMMAAVAVMSTFAVNASAVTITKTVGKSLATVTLVKDTRKATFETYINIPTYAYATCQVTYGEFNYKPTATGNTLYKTGSYSNITNSYTSLTLDSYQRKLFKN